MSLPSIGQAQMLAEELEAALDRLRPASMALIGCAGGNGLEQIGPDQICRIVAIDINPNYLRETAARHASRLPGLECRCADVESELPDFEPVDLVYAALLFEYVDAAAALRNLSAICRSGGSLIAILQLPGVSQPAVSPSPYRSLDRLGSVMRLLSPQQFGQCAAAAGFVAGTARTITLPSGKQFWVHQAERSVR